MMSSLLGGRGQADQIVELRGLLGAIGWGSRDQVTRIALFTANEEIYEVELDASSVELLQHLRKMIEIQGSLTTSKQGMKAISVGDFRVIE